MIIPRLYKVCQSVSAYIAGNPRDAKSCHLVTHVNLITSNEVTEDIFDRVIHSCVDLNPDSFYDVILIRKLEIKMKLMTKIPNNLTPKSMSLILIIIALKKHQWKFRAIVVPRTVCYTFISLLYIWNCRNHIKYNFLRKKKQIKI